MVKGIYRKYSNFLMSEYWIVLILFLLISFGLVMQALNVEIVQFDYKTILPDDSRTMTQMHYTEDNFVNTDTIDILIYMDKSASEVDYKDYQYRKFVSDVENNLETMPFVDNIQNLNTLLALKNDNNIKVNDADFLKIYDNDDYVISPIDILSYTDSYVQSFNNLSNVLNEQYEGISKLENASFQILENTNDLNDAIKKVEKATDSARNLDVNSGAEELKSGVNQIKSSLSQIRQSLNLSYCEPTLIDPIYSTNLSLIANPYFNQTSCYYFGSQKISESYLSYKTIFCNSSLPYYDETKCETYTKLANDESNDLTTSQALSQLESSLNLVVVGVDELENGLEDFKSNIVELNSALSKISYNLDLFESGISSYHDNMVVLKNQTFLLKSQVESFNDELQSNYGLVKDNVDLSYEPKQFQFNNKEEFGRFISLDKTSSRIQVTLKKKSDYSYASKMVSEMMDNMEKPENVNVIVTGLPIEVNKLLDMVPSSISSSSTYASVFIILILLILIRRIVLSGLTMSTILFGALWTFGFLGIIKMNLNAASSAALSMILGIGIDFGIQIVSEFIEQFFNEKKELNYALETTFKLSFTPILITTSSALIGFFAMSLAEVQIMKDMSYILIIGISFCVIAAFTVLPSLLIAYVKILELIENKKNINE